MKVFSIEKFKEDLRKKGMNERHLTPFSMYAEIGLDGKTEEELKQMGLVICDEWMVEKEESINEWIENELKKEVTK